MSKKKTAKQNPSIAYGSRIRAAAADGWTIMQQRSKVKGVTYKGDYYAVNKSQEQTPSYANLGALLTRIKF